MFARTRGKVVTPHTIHAKRWTVIEISDGGAFERILESIHCVGDGKFWKGFTGPLESQFYSNYRIWVDLEAYEGDSGDFTVTGFIGPFRVDDKRYSQRKGYCFEVTYG